MFNETEKKLTQENSLSVVFLANKLLEALTWNCTHGLRQHIRKEHFYYIFRLWFELLWAALYSRKEGIQILKKKKVYCCAVFVVDVRQQSQASRFKEGSSLSTTWKPSSLELGARKKAWLLCLREMEKKSAKQSFTLTKPSYTSKQNLQAYVAAPPEL